MIEKTWNCPLFKNQYDILQGQFYRFFLVTDISKWFFAFSLAADEIPKEDTVALLAELADPEDEDGFFPYTPFIDRLTGKA